MSDELRAALKLVRQKVQRAELAINRADLKGAALEIKLAELAVKDLGHLIGEAA